MGAVLGILTAIGELTALTGFTAEAILTGEAAAALTAQVSALIALEGLTEVQALTALGLTAESLVLTTSIAEAFQAGTTTLASLLTGGLSIGAAALGAEALGGPNNMALQVWQPEVWVFPEARWFYDAYHYFDPYGWLPSLIEQISQQFWQRLQQTGARQIAHESTAIALRTTNRLWYTIAEAINNAVWYVRSGYYALQDYYSVLPTRMGPPRLVEYLQQHRYSDWLVDPPEFTAQGSSVEEEQGPFSNWRDTLKKLKKWTEFSQEKQSGQRVDRVQPPGGANQVSTPDWLLPLILGLFGDLTPTFAADISSYGSKINLKRKRKISVTRPQAGGKRRRRSTKRRLRTRQHYSNRGVSKS